MLHQEWSLWWEIRAAGLGAGATLGEGAGILLGALHPPRSRDLRRDASGIGVTGSEPHRGYVPPAAAGSPMGSAHPHTPCCPSPRAHLPEHMLSSSAPRRQAPPRAAPRPACPFLAPSPGQPGGEGRGPRAAGVGASPPIGADGVETAQPWLHPARQCGQEAPSCQGQPRGSCCPPLTGPRCPAPSPWGKAGERGAGALHEGGRMA